MSANTPEPAITGNDGESDANPASSRLMQEARRPQAFGSRGVKDITEEFAAAAKQLPPGQLVKDEYFTLFESVGALEIMDPKMDSGYIPPGDTMEPEFDVCQGLTPDSVLWIMDHLLCLAIIWHDGYPLSQTVFTSLHVDRLLAPDNRRLYCLTRTGEGFSNSTEYRLVHLVLRAFCTAIIKSCALVLFTIQGQNFYEEEDFVTHLFGRELLPGLSAEDAVQQVVEASSWLEGSDVAEDLKQALAARLAFVSTYVGSLVNDRSEWHVLMGMLDGINAMHELGEPCPAAFSDKVQRQLATSTPPRPMPNIIWDQAYTKWQAMFKDVTEADRLTTPAICQNPHSLQKATWAFADREPQPNTFVRSYMQSALFSNEQITEGVTFFDLLLSDLRGTVFGGHSAVHHEAFQIEVPTDSRHRGARILEVFMDKAFDEYMNVYRMVCQNRCRIRRTFTQAVAIFDGLESEAMVADRQLFEIDGLFNRPEAARDSGVSRNPGFLASWTQYYKLRIMSWSVQLGFETDIYMQDELCMMYWFLHTLAQRRRKQLEHIQQGLIERVAMLEGEKHLRISPAAEEAKTCRDFLDGLCAQAGAEEHMAMALYRLTGLLAALKVVDGPPRDYVLDNDRLYEARMKPYLSVCNQPIPSMQDFLDTQKRDMQPVAATCWSISQVLAHAKSCLAELKRLTPEKGRYVGTEEQWKRENKQLETTCVAIAVQSSQILRIAEKAGMQDAKLGDKNLKGLVKASVLPVEKRYHRWWAVPQIREVKA